MSKNATDRLVRYEQLARRLETILTRPMRDEVRAALERYLEEARAKCVQWRARVEHEQGEHST